MLEYRQYTPGMRPTKHRPWSWREFSIAFSLIPVSFLLWLGGLAMAIQPRPDPTTYLIGVLCAGASPIVATAGAIWMLAIIWRRFLR